jgi:hypothetical protein
MHKPAHGGRNLRYSTRVLENASLGEDGMLSPDAGSQFHGARKSG